MRWSRRLLGEVSHDVVMGIADAYWDGMSIFSEMDMEMRRWIWMKMRMSRRDARWRLPIYESPVSDLCVEPGERCRKQAELII